MKRLSSFAFLLCLGSLAHADNNSTDPPTYRVNLVDPADAPVIDGVVSTDEWMLSEDAAGDWVELGGDADTHNLRFRMLWDSTNLYILGETDYDQFPNATDAFDDPDFTGTAYTYSFFIDPNKGGEDLAERTDETVDGYQISWHMDRFFSSRMPTEDDATQALRDPRVDGELANFYIPGLTLEAHVNSLEGNDGGWDLSDDGPNLNYRDDNFPGLVFAQNANNQNVNDTGAPGGVFEWSIAWAELNATNPDRILSEADGELVDEDSDLYLGDVGDPDPRFSDPESEHYLGNGLFAVDGPSPDDVWTFELGVVTPDTDNSMPSWSQPKDGDSTRTSFASWGESGHGRLQFVGLLFDPLDCNEDGVVDSGDLACMTPETLDETLERLNLIPGDLDANYAVDFDDFLRLSANFEMADVGYPNGDIDLSGAVDFDDFLRLSGNFGKMSEVPGEGGGGVAAVPEPSGFGLLLLGGALLFRRRRFV